MPLHKEIPCRASSNVQKGLAGDGGAILGNINLKKVGGRGGLGLGPLQL